MPIDPSILLQSQGVQVPNPMDMAGKALTLGNLSNTNQLGNIQVMQQLQQMKMMADPRFSQAMAQSLGGAPASGQATGQGSPDFGFMSDYPAAGMGAIENLLKMQQTAAATRKDSADAQLASANEFVKRSDLLGNFAAAVARDPNDMNYGRALNQVGMIPNGRAYFQPPPLDASPQERVQWAAGVANSVTDPQKQQQMLVELGKFAPQVAEMVANARKANIEADQAPAKLAVSQQEAQTKLWEYLHGKTEISPKTGDLYQVTGEPGGGSSARPVYTAQDAQAAALLKANPSAIVDAGPNGELSVRGAPSPAPTPYSPGLSASDNEQKAALGVRLKENAANAQIANRILQITPALRELVASGYNGPLAASETGKTVLAQLDAAGILPAGMANKLADMRAGDAFMGSLVGPLAHELNTRGSNASLKFILSSKAGSENSATTRIQMLNALDTDAKNLLSSTNALSDYARNNPADLGLTGFKQPTPQTIKGQRVDALPDPVKTPVGTQARGDDGTVYVNNGKAWVTSR